MGEHLPCKQGVRGSNPLISTRYLKEYRNTIKCCTISKLKAAFVSRRTYLCNVNLENFIQRDIIIKPFIINKTSEKIFKYVEKHTPVF